MKRQWSLWPWAPFFLGVYPVLQLYSLNLDYVEPRAVFEPFLVGLLLAVGVTAVSMAITRSLAKGTLVASLLFFISILSLTLAEMFYPWPAEIFPSPYGEIFLTDIPLLLTVLAYWGFRKTKDVSSGVRGVNAIALCLILFPVSRIAVHGKDLLVNACQHPVSPVIQTNPLQRHPDIYYIILDGYTRADILKNDFGYDNSRFINFLKQKGFYIADQSRSNYAYTYLSLASSLNMDYLTGMSGVQNQQAECLRRIHQNKLMPDLKLRGYRIQYLPSGWSATNDSPYADRIFDSPNLNEFHGLCLRVSLLRPLWNQTMLHAGRNRILYMLDTLETMAPSAVPTFTFAHLLCPHPPYIFDRKGQLPPPRHYPNRPAGSRDWYPKDRYVDQIDFLNGRVMRAIDHILKISPKPPIIVIQGDHGAACDGTASNPTPLMVRERMSILNAYYVPESIRRQLYPTISPVNSFRIILRSLFNVPLPPLADKSLYSGAMDNTPYVFQDVAQSLDQD